MSLHRSAIAAVSAQVVPAFRSPFSHRPTQVVTIPLRRCIPLLISTSTLLMDSLNVRRVSCGGDLMSLGASIYQSFVILRALTGFVHHMYCGAVHRIFTASYQVALSSPSTRVRFLATMSLALPSIGPSTWYLGPLFLWSGVMIEGLDLAVMLNSLFHLRRIPPV